MVMNGVLRTPAHWPLPIGKVIGIKQAKRLLGALIKVVFVALKRLHPADVHIAKIKRFLPVLHPLRQCHARAASRLNANRIEPGRDPDIVHLRRKAKVIGVVGRKTLRPIKERMNPRIGKHRHPVHRRFEDRLKVVEILRQLVKFEILGDTVHCPGFGIRLKRPEHDLARIFLVIGAFVRHPQHRHRRQPLIGSDTI